MGIGNAEVGNINSTDDRRQRTDVRGQKTEERSWEAGRLGNWMVEPTGYISKIDFLNLLLDGYDFTIIKIKIYLT